MRKCITAQNINFNEQQDSNIIINIRCYKTHFAAKKTCYLIKIYAGPVLQWFENAPIVNIGPNGVIMHHYTKIINFSDQYKRKLL